MENSINSLFVILYLGYPEMFSLRIQLFVYKENYQLHHAETLYCGELSYVHRFLDLIH